MCVDLAFMSLQIVICERFVAGFDYKSSDLISTVATLQNQKWLIVEVSTPFSCARKWDEEMGTWAI